MFQSRILCLLFLICLQNIFSVSLAAQVNPSIKWKKISLKHFELIYDSQHQQLAEIYAARLTGALQNLRPFFEQIPEKTVVVIHDQTDLTNGYATPIPYPMIMIYPVLPSSQDSIGEFGDWASEIITHEYAHVLATNQRRDTVAVLENIFGSIMVPNMLLPRWWHEGLAVEMETRFSNHGRLRSSQQEGWLRSYVLEDALDQVNLPEANEVTHPHWPYGARPYFFGSYFWSELAQENPENVKKLSWRHAGRLPYLLETAAQEEIGMSYADYFAKTKTRLKELAQSQIHSLRKVPESEGAILPLPFIDIDFPRLSPDGLKLAFIGKDDSSRRSLQILVRKSTNEEFQVSNLLKTSIRGDGERASEMKAPVPQSSEKNNEDGPPGGTITGISWHPDSEKIVYDRVKSIKTYQEVSQLWIYDLQTSQSSVLQNTLRAREPAFSPDGSAIVFVGIEAGKTNLSIYQLATEKKRVLLNTSLQSRVGSPIFQGANTVYFSYRVRGQENIYALDLLSKKSTRLPSQFANLRLEGTQQNQLLLLSDVNGVTNAYFTDLQNHRPLTHSLTSIDGAAFDPYMGDLYFTEQTASGLKLKRLAKFEKNPLPYPLPTTGGKMLAARYAQSTKAQLPPAENISTVQDYSALPYLLPKYWLPMIYWNSYSSYFSIMTAANDPLQKHNWSFYGNYDFASGKLGYDISYLNQTTEYPLFFNSVDQTISFAGGLSQRSQLAFMQISFPNNGFGMDWNFGFGLSYLNREDQNNNSTQTGPTSYIVYQNYSQSGAQISPESGLGASLRVTNYLPLSGMTNFNQYDFSYVHFFSKFLPAHHAIMWKTQWAYLDKAVASSNFVFSQSQPLQNNSVYPTYLMRGYATGAFQGRSLLQTSLEYRTPLLRLYRGWDFAPIYLKQLHGAFIVDGVATDGYVFDPQNRLYRRSFMERNYWSTGFELKLDSTLGYHFPIMFYTGIYYPLDQSLNPGANLALGIFL